MSDTVPDFFTTFGSTPPGEAEPAGDAAGTTAEDQKQDPKDDKSTKNADSSEKQASGDDKSAKDSDSSEKQEPSDDKPKPAKKTAAKSSAKKSTTRKSPAKKSASKAANTDLQAAVDSLIAEGDAALDTVSPTASPIEVLTAVRKITAALDSEALQSLSVIVEKAEKFDTKYNDFVVDTLDLDENGSGEFDGFKVTEGRVDLPDE